MIPVHNQSGKVVFYIDNGGNLIDATDARTVPTPKDPRGEPEQSHWLPITQPIAHVLLKLESISTALDGNTIFTFSVGKHGGGDLVRWIGKDGGYWDLWRPAGTKVDMAYVGKVK